MPREGHKFDVAHRRYLDSAERKAYLDAEGILRKFRLPKGGRIADVGCGTGFFALPASTLLGPRGHVYAVDVSEEMLTDLRAKLTHAGRRNVEPILSSEDRIPLEGACVDFVFMGCVLHEFDGLGTLREAHRILRPAGRLGVVDWKKEDMDLGPPTAHRLDTEEARALLKEADFEPVHSFEAGRYHYAIEARARHS